MNSPEVDALILRACQPQAGDRFVADSVVIEVRAIDPNTEAYTNEPAYQKIVEFTDSRNGGKCGYLFIGEFGRMAQSAIHNHGPAIFHAVEAKA